MPSESVCLLCLSTNTPTRDLTDSPLRCIYEKLTNVPIWDGPTAACYLCYSQLKNCHTLMTRAVTAYTLLTQMKQSGVVVNRESISNIDREAYRLNDRRSITVPDSIIIIDHDKIEKVKTNDDAVSCHRVEFKSKALLDIEDIKREVSEESGRNIKTKDKILLYGNVELMRTSLDVDYIKREVSVELEDIDTGVLANRRYVNTEVSKKEEHFQDEGLTCESNLVLTNIKREIPEGIEVFECERWAGGSGKYNKIFVDTDVKESECENVDSNVLTNEQVMNHDLAADNEHYTLIDIEEMKIEYDEDGAAPQQCEKTCNESQDNMLITEVEKTLNKTKCTADTKEIEEKHKITLKQQEVQKKINKNKFQCSVCQRILCNRTKLTLHYRIHTGEKPHECEICQYRCRQLGTLKIHMKSHSDEKPFECPICQDRFRLQSDLKTHMKSHCEDRPFECAICQHRFKQQIHLKIHMKRHSEERPFECGICQKRFKHKSHMIQHIKIHTGEKSFECTICQSKFRHKSNLTDHMGIHDKPFKCALCPSRFSQKRSLTVHVRTHTEDKTFICKICQSKFERPNVSNERGKYSVCLTCEAKYTFTKDYRNCVRTYARKKSFECIICNHKFSDRDTLVAHLTTHKS